MYLQSFKLSTPPPPPPSHIVKGVQDPKKSSYSVYGSGLTKYVAGPGNGGNRKWSFMNKIDHNGLCPLNRKSNDSLCLV